MSEWLCSFFSNSVNADWAVAFATILLVIVTLIFYFMDDNYTRLIKNIEVNKFDKLAYDFLDVSFASWSFRYEAPTPKPQTVEEHIDDFRQKILANSIYMRWKEKNRFSKYVNLAQDHAKAWSDANIDLVKVKQNEILNEMEWLAKRLGKEVEFNKIKNNFLRNQ